MDMIFSKRATQIEEGIFSILNTKKEELLQAGREVYNFSVGTPDFKTPEHIMKAMEEACKDPDNYKYAMADRPEMLEAMKNFYKNRFGVELETDQIMSMYGSQEGMAHIALVMCDPGDVVLVPNPGYPVFGMGPQLMGAKVETYPLYEKNNFLPDFADIPEKTAKVAKFMIISYPANPVCSVADDSFYEKAIAFAKKYNVILLHDNAYSDIIFGGKEGKSFLSYKGAMEVGIEFYSLSKSYNMTGMRISFALGNKDVIQMFLKPFPDRRLSEMPKRWIPNIMDEPCTEQYITNILFHLWRKFRILPISKNILSNILTKRLGKGRNLQRMGQPGSHKVALIQRKYLGLILKPPK